jgi:hypothetical protein
MFSISSSMPRSNFRRDFALEIARHMLQRIEHEAGDQHGHDQDEFRNLCISGASRVGLAGRSHPRSAAWAVRRCGCRREASPSARAGCVKASSSLAPTWPLKGRSKDWLRPLRHIRHMARARGKLAPARCEEALHDAVFQRMEGHDDEAPAGRSMRSAACSASTSSSSSPFTWMRSAWKVRGGCVRSCGPLAAGGALHRRTRRAWW